MSDKVQAMGQAVANFLSQQQGRQDFDSWYIRTQVLMHANAVGVLQSLLDVVANRQLRDLTMTAEEEATTHQQLALQIQRQLDTGANAAPPASP